jgi:hypothetical protein
MSSSAREEKNQIGMGLTTRTHANALNASPDGQVAKRATGERA